MKKLCLLLLLGTVLASAQCVQWVYNSRTRSMDCAGTWNTGIWKKYPIVKVANGVSGCATAKGCWLKPDGTTVAAETATTQVITWLTSTANTELQRARWKTVTACAGLTAITLTDLGTTAGAGEFFTGGTYNLKTAVSATNLIWPTLLTPGATAASTAWTVTLSAGAENVDDVTNGCAFDIHAKWAVLP